MLASAESAGSGTAPTGRLLAEYIVTGRRPGALAAFDPLRRAGLPGLSGR